MRPYSPSCGSRRLVTAPLRTRLGVRAPEAATTVSDPLKRPAGVSLSAPMESGNGSRAGSIDG